MLFDTLTPFLRYIHKIDLIPPFTTHRHIAYDQRLFFCLQGTHTVTAGENVFSLTEHSLLFVPSGTAYRLHRPQECVRLIGVNFDWTSAHRDLTVPIPPAFGEKDYRPEAVLEHIVFDDLPMLNQPLFLEGVSAFAPLISRMLEEYEARRLYYLPLCTALLKEWAVLLARTLAAPLPGGTAESVIRYLQENYRRPLSNEEIGRELSFHPNYLSRVLKQYTGLTLHQYLLSVRMNKALGLLHSTSLTVSQIAQEVGFRDVQQFSKSFSARFGASPGSFR